MLALALVSLALAHPPPPAQGDPWREELLPALRAGHVEAAIERAWAAVLSDEPRWASPIRSLAQRLRRVGRQGEVLELLLEASARCGTDLLAEFFRACLDGESALILAELGRFDEAEALLAEIASRPFGAAGFVELQRAEVYLVAGEKERALEVWRRATEDPYASYEAHGELADWHGARGEHEERLLHLLRRRASAPGICGIGASDEGDAYTALLARCELDLGRRAEALARLRPRASGFCRGGASSAELFVDLRLDAGEEALLERELDSWSDAPHVAHGPAAARAHLAHRRLLRDGTVTELWEAYLAGSSGGRAAFELRERLCAEAEVVAHYAWAAIGGPGEDHALALLADLGDESILPLLERRVGAAAALWREDPSKGNLFARELGLLARLRTSAARELFARHFGLGAQLGLEDGNLVELP